MSLTFLQTFVPSTGSPGVFSTDPTKHLMKFGQFFGSDFGSLGEPPWKLNLQKCMLVKQWCASSIVIDSESADGRQKNEDFFDEVHSSGYFLSLGLPHIENSRKPNFLQTLVHILGPLSVSYERLVNGPHNGECENEENRKRANFGCLFVVSMCLL